MILPRHHTDARRSYVDEQGRVMLLCGQIEAYTAVTNRSYDLADSHNQTSISITIPSPRL